MNLITEANVITDKLRHFIVEQHLKPGKSTKSQLNHIQNIK